MKKIKEQYNKLNEIMENIDNIISDIEKESVQKMLWTGQKSIQIKEDKNMLTEEQKREFERIFNFYSLQKEYDSECRAEWSDKMWAFRTAVSILFYKFTFDKFEEKNGVEYSSYILEEIRN